MKKQLFYKAIDSYKNPSAQPCTQDVGKDTGCKVQKISLDE